MWMMTWLRHRLGTNNPQCVVHCGRTTAQRQPGHCEVFTYLLTVTLQEYLMLLPWMGCFFFLFLLALTLLHCMSYTFCFWICWTTLAETNRFLTGLFFPHVYRQAGNAGCASAYIPDGNTHQSHFILWHFKSLQGKNYLSFWWRRR